MRFSKAFFFRNAHRKICNRQVKRPDSTETRNYFPGCCARGPLVINTNVLWEGVRGRHGPEYTDTVTEERRFVMVKRLSTDGKNLQSQQFLVSKEEEDLPSPVCY